MKRRTIVRFGIAAALLSLPSSSLSDSDSDSEQEQSMDADTDSNSKAVQELSSYPVKNSEENTTSKECRCVDDPLEIADLETTASAPSEKRDKVYSSIWKPSTRQGPVGVVTTLFNVHSKEALPVLRGQIPPREVLDFFFRCRGFGTVMHLDEKLVETAVAAAVHFKSMRIEVISGYRSQKFNDALSKKGRHVAGESKHTMAAAMDFRLTSKDSVTVGNWLFSNFEGGVGIYAKDDFVHIDTGAERRWRGR